MDMLHILSCLFPCPRAIQLCLVEAGRWNWQSYMSHKPYVSSPGSPSHKALFINSCIVFCLSRNHWFAHMAYAYSVVLLPGSPQKKSGYRVGVPGCCGRHGKKGRVLPKGRCGVQLRILRVKVAAGRRKQSGPSYIVVSWEGRSSVSGSKAQELPMFKSVLSLVVLS